jgi:hypothetical protein
MVDAKRARVPSWRILVDMMHGQPQSRWLLVRRDVCECSLGASKGVRAESNYLAATDRCRGADCSSLSATSSGDNSEATSRVSTRFDRDSMTDDCDDRDAHGSETAGD